MPIKIEHKEKSIKQLYPLIKKHIINGTIVLFFAPCLGIELNLSIDNKGYGKVFDNWVEQNFEVVDSITITNC